MSGQAGRPEGQGICLSVYSQSNWLPTESVFLFEVQLHMVSGDSVQECGVRLDMKTQQVLGNSIAVTLSTLIIVLIAVRTCLIC